MFPRGTEERGGGKGIFINGKKGERKSYINLQGRPETRKIYIFLSPREQREGKGDPSYS